MTSYDMARNEVWNYLRAMKSWTGDRTDTAQPMEIDILTKGGRGKSKGKNKSKGKAKTDEVCFYCAKPGRRKRECRFFQQEHKVHPDMAGKYKDQSIDKDGNRKKKEKEDGTITVL